MADTKWFLVSVEAAEREGLESRLAAAGFTQEEDGYHDTQQRKVRVGDTDVHIGIPASDVVSEQEQLEFLLGVLGLDEDNAHSV